MTYVLPVTEARKDFLHLVDKVDEEYLRVDITKQGKIKASLVSPEYLDELEETIYSMTHSMNAIRKAKKERTDGQYVTLDTFLKGYHAGKTIPPASKRAEKRTKTA